MKTIKTIFLLFAIYLMVLTVLMGIGLSLKTIIRTDSNYFSSELQTKTISSISSTENNFGSNWYLHIEDIQDKIQVPESIMPNIKIGDSILVFKDENAQYHYAGLTTNEIEK